jgi:gas vesicle protein
MSLFLAGFAVGVIVGSVTVYLMVMVLSRESREEEDRINRQRFDEERK